MPKKIKIEVVIPSRREIEEMFADIYEIHKPLRPAERSETNAVARHDKQVRSNADDDEIVLRYLDDPSREADVAAAMMRVKLGKMRLPGLQEAVAKARAALELERGRARAAVIARGENMRDSEQEIADAFAPALNLICEAEEAIDDSVRRHVPGFAGTRPVTWPKTLEQRGAELNAQRQIFPLAK